MNLNRSSGILMHITSLPSSFGIGDLGPSAYEFIEFLKVSGHTYWQILPLNPTKSFFSHSPYSSFSAFGGNPLLISPRLLDEQGLVDLKEHRTPEISNPEKIDFTSVENYKNILLEDAFRNFKKTGRLWKDYREFCENEVHWLPEHSLYVALQQKFSTAWSEWPKALRDREEAALKKAKDDFSEAIEKENFIQFLFYQQWRDLVKFAQKNEIGFFGDIPFYINHDSVDCWANQNYFKLGKDKEPIAVSGVPPDYFSKTGQLWGTPVFNWEKLQEGGFSWWIKRIKHNLRLFSLVRLDHFRAFSAYWEVPAKESTAVNGKWVKVPGEQFFKKLGRELRSMKLVAEDLGDLDEPVYELIEQFDFPGMRVLQFAFGDDMPETIHIPHRHQRNSIVYTGTHDNNTSQGWYKSQGRTERKNLKKYSGKKVSKKNVHKILHRMALGSVGDLAIVPLQDVLGLGEEAKMNIPGTTEGNWAWRLSPDIFLLEKAGELKNLNVIFGRSSLKEKKKTPEKKEADE